jgi:hypothetical protein
LQVLTLAPVGSDWLRGRVILNLPLRVIFQKNKRPNAAKRWCFTWNNPPDDCSERLESILLPKKALFLHGKEVAPTTGTVHRQGFVLFPDKVRPMELVKVKEIHWEKMKGSIADNVAYCTKDGEDIQGNHPYDKPLILPDIHGWQLDVVDLIKTEPDNRSIHWYWEETGGFGKSSLVRYLCIRHGALLLSGKAADMKYGIVAYKEKQGTYPTLIVVDMPRVMQDYISYAGIEEVKNGVFFSTKYESGMAMMNHPHILCFANFEPDYSKMSEDRWKVVYLRS